jgi:hypothetical protein
VAAVSGAENPQVIRWLEPGLLFSQVLCRPQLKVLACCMCNKSCMEHCISLAMKQRMTAAHHQHTARLQQQDIPPLYKPSCSQSSELVYALHILGPERTSFRCTTVRRHGSVPCIACIFRTTYSYMAFPDQVRSIRTSSKPNQSDKAFRTSAFGRCRTSDEVVPWGLHCLYECVSSVYC